MDVDKNTLIDEALKVCIPEVITRANVDGAAEELEEKANVNCVCALHDLTSEATIAVTM